jgi:AbrB family looped-hinge helix DNA binding protein
MNDKLASVTRKGQITLPIEIRRSLGVVEGDKIAVSLVQTGAGEKPQAILKPVHSVAQMTYGAVSTPPSISKPADIKALRRVFEEGVAEEVMSETPLK